MNASVKKRLLICPNGSADAERIQNQLAACFDISLVQRLTSLPRGEANADPNNPDVVLFSTDAEQEALLETIRLWRASAQNLRMIAYVKPEERALLQSLWEAGVAGFVDEASTAQEITSAVQALEGDGVYLSRPLFQALSTEAAPHPDGTDPYGFTKREREILRLICDNLTSKAIARQLGLSLRTVETHRLNIRKKAQARSRSSLVEVARRTGVINDTP